MQVIFSHLVYLIECQSSKHYVEIITREVDDCLDLLLYIELRTDILNKIELRYLLVYHHARQVARGKQPSINKYCTTPLVLQMQQLHYHI